MADPFKPQSSQQLIREAKIGLSVVALLFTTLIYVGTLRMTGQRPILPFNQMVGLDNTNAVPSSPKKKLPKPKTAQSTQENSHFSKTTGRKLILLKLSRIKISNFSGH